jgi:hypothetical protein
MISWTVLNESYGKYPEPPEQFTGKLFRVFSRSHLILAGPVFTGTE